MKKIPLLFFLGMGPFLIKAQSLTTEVIGTSGDFYETSAGSLSWTIGEPISETVGNTDYTLTQGFHQTKFTVVSVEESLKNVFDVSVYPNPAIEEFQINIKSEKQTSDFQYQLHDQSGRILREGVIQENQTTIKLNGLANSIYLLKVWSDNESYHKIYQVLKIK